MSDQQEDKLDKIIAKLETIERGVYGDPQNQVPGLIETDRSQDKRITALEDQNKKQKYTIAGIGLASGIGFPYFIEWVKKHLG